MKAKKRKNILIVALVAAMLFMSVAYAILSQQLNITGNISAQGNTWKVEITEISVNSTSGAAVSESETFTLTSANFTTQLTRPGDAVNYIITVENKGTIDATLESITSNMAELMADQSYIKYELTGASVDSTLAAGGTSQVGVNVSFDSSATSLPEDTITQSLNVTLNYVQK